MFIDTHCHISKNDYENPEEIIKHMDGNIMIISGADPKDLEEIIDLCESHSNIFATIGIHPEFASTYTKENLDNLEKYLTHPKVVGIGEVGLDYHYTKENINEQKDLFIKQINLANKYNKTLVIHCRDAMEDTYNILKQYKDKNTKLDFHCYSGDEIMGKKLLEMGATFGIGGILTFKNDKRLKKVVKSLPIESFVFETDSPYLTPEPLRGHQNEPANIKYTAKYMAELLDMDINKLYEITTKTAIRQFDLENKLC